VEFFLGIVIVAICGLLAWVAFRVEPHWCSKDGRRMIARAQLLPDPHQPASRWNEVRVFVSENTVILRTRGMRATELRGQYRVVAKSAEPPKKQEIYILHSDKEVLIRIPRNSRAITTFEGLLSSNN